MRALSGDDGDDGDDSFALPTWLSYMVITVLIMLSGLFSGLTLGLLSLDMNGLKIIIDSDDEKEARLARIIEPVRKNGNLLLCTLLLGNVAVNALLSILMANLTSGLVGFLSSTIIIVIFGEIVPQASCSRYPLQIGAFAVPLVKVFMWSLIIFTYPLAAVLDWALGQELGTIYTTDRLIALLHIHQEHGVVDTQQSLALAGALQYKDMQVSEVMTKIDEVYMLSHDATLSFKILREIFQTGFSRIPVYGAGGREDIIGLVMVKDLIFVDPEDETPVQRFADILGRKFEVVHEDEKLGDVLQTFKKGRGHLAVVRGIVEFDDGRDSTYCIRGIITLEDIVEAILGDEIVDETDNYVHMEKKDRVNRADFDYGRLDLLDSKLNQNTLSPEEVNAIAAHLTTNYSIFKCKPGTEEAIDVEDVKALVAHGVKHALTLKREATETSPAPAKVDYVYTRHRPATRLTLVLSGKLSVAAGKDAFRSEAGPWTVLGADALSEDEGSYLPDFSAFIATEQVRCIQITRAAYATHVLKEEQTIKYGAAANVGAGPRRSRGNSSGMEEFRRPSAGASTDGNDASAASGGEKGIELSGVKATVI